MIIKQNQKKGDGIMREQMVLQTNTVYDFKSFNKGEYEITLDNNSIYGSNQTRTELKVVEVNGFLLHNISKIILKVNDSVIFDFCNEDGQIVVRHLMTIYESLKIKKTGMGSLDYKFGEVVA